ncbi:MAG TPA: Crp/Fnr family transcriptional regulator [Chloroflexota bacterium]|nr:Crp/Fnr family transcriptional regulator [Chloroflexota bacterium]
MSDAAENRLLAALPAPTRTRLVARSEVVALAVRRTLHEADQPIADVYFPLAGVVSLTTITVAGDVVEVGLVGHEGLVGLPALLDAGSSPFRSMVQVGGRARRIAAPLLREETRRDAAFLGLVHRYAHLLLTQTAQAAACNRLHPVEQRLARWLLMVQDRVGDSRFPLTQEFMAMMLGVRRGSVNIAAGMLQHAGFVAYRRGTLTVLDRAGLESAACECYRLIRAEYERLFPAHGAPGGR